MNREQLKKDSNNDIGIIQTIKKIINNEYNFKEDVSLENIYNKFYGISMQLADIHSDIRDTSKKNTIVKDSFLCKLDTFYANINESFRRLDVEETEHFNLHYGNYKILSQKYETLSIQYQSLLQEIKLLNINRMKEVTLTREISNLKKEISNLSIFSLFRNTLIQILVFIFDFFSYLHELTYSYIKKIKKYLEIRFRRKKFITVEYNNNGEKVEKVKELIRYKNFKKLI